MIAMAQPNWALSGQPADSHVDVSEQSGGNPMSTGMRNRITGIAQLAIFLGLVALALAVFTRGGEPECNSTTMHPGDRCVSSKGGSSTYEEMKRARESMMPVIITGGVVAAASVTLIGLRLTRPEHQSA
ncbi:hypothetical protein ACWEVD_13730 [Nocardia thailandica]